MKEERKHRGLRTSFSGTGTASSRQCRRLSRTLNPRDSGVSGGGAQRPLGVLSDLCNPQSLDAPFRKKDAPGRTLVIDIGIRQVQAAAKLIIRIRRSCVCRGLAATECLVIVCWFTRSECCLVLLCMCAVFYYNECVVHCGLRVGNQNRAQDVGRQSSPSCEVSCRSACAFFEARAYN